MPSVAKTAPRTQEQRRNDARTALIRAAAELIADGGLPALTLASVGERAGYSRGIANHHFGTKAQLVTELIDRVEEEFVQATSRAADDATDALQQVVRTFLGLLHELPVMHRAFLVLWATAATGDETIRARMAASDEAFRRGLVDVLTTRPGVPLDSAGPTATILVGVLRGVAIQYLLSPSSIDLPAVKRSTLGILDHLVN